MKRCKYSFVVAAAVVFLAASGAQAISDGTYGLGKKSNIAGPTGVDVNSLGNLLADGQPFSLNLHHRRTNVTMTVSDGGSTVHLLGKAFGRVHGKRGWMWNIDLVYTNVQEIDSVLTPFVGGNSGTMQQAFGQELLYVLTEEPTPGTFSFVLESNNDGISGAGDEDAPNGPGQDDPGVATPEPATAVLGLMAMAGLGMTCRRRRAD